MFTNYTIDLGTLIYRKHKYRENIKLMDNSAYWHPTLELENRAIREMFTEIREMNARSKQPGNWEAVAEVCDQFLDSIREELALKERAG